MTRHQDTGTACNSHKTAHESAQPPSEPRWPLPDISPFEAEMFRVAVLDLGEEGSGCTPFILATSDLSLEARRDLLLQASGALLGYCDRHGASECLKYARGLEHAGPSAELDQVIEDGLLKISVAAALDDDEASEEDTRQDEDLVRFIDEVHSK